MNKRTNRLSMTLVTVLLVLLLSAMWTVPALADGPPPPPGDAQETEETVEETPPAEEVSEEVPPVEEDAEPPVEETEEAAGELLSQLPDDTEVVVTDERGKTVPLSTQEAEEAVEDADPIWCPAGVHWIH